MFELQKIHFFLCAVAGVCFCFTHQIIIFFFAQYWQVLKSHPTKCFNNDKMKKDKHKLALTTLI